MRTRSTNGRSNVDRPDPARRTGSNAGDGSVWGSRVAPVTGRQSRRTAGWTPVIAGGEYVDVRWVTRARVTARYAPALPATPSDVRSWHAFTPEAETAARRIIAHRFPVTERADAIRSVIARRWYV